MSGVSKDKLLQIFGRGIEHCSELKSIVLGQQEDTRLLSGEDIGRWRTTTLVTTRLKARDIHAAR
jgi:hypothetical protein